MFFKLLIMGFLSFNNWGFSAEIDTTKIMEYSDRTRGAIPEGLQWNVKLTSIEEDETTERDFFIK